MGCCSDHPSVRPNVPEEELLITHKEQELGYRSIPASRVLAAIKSNSERAKVSIEKFNTIAVDLALNTKDIDSLDVPLGMFYQKLKEKGKYDLLKLGVLGVLLGSASFLRCSIRCECRGTAYISARRGNSQSTLRLHFQLNARKEHFSREIYELDNERERQSDSARLCRCL